MEYNIRMEFRLPPTEESAEEVFDALERFAPGPGQSDSSNGNLDVWITLQANNARQAIDLGLALASQATSAELLAFEVITTADFDRRESVTPMPELVSSEEAASLLGISRQAVLKQHAEGKLRGHRVGERTVVFARPDVEAAVARRTGGLDTPAGAVSGRSVKVAP